MYKRRKLLLALLESLGGKIERLRLQKLLFLVCTEQPAPSYHFLPYKYGCFSFQANMDLVTLRKKGMVTDQNDCWSASGKGWLESLDQEDLEVLNRITSEFKTYRNEELIRYTYLHFPFYAVRSTILEQYLSREECERVHNSVSRDSSPLLMTLGYEGRSLEQYISILIGQNIRLLCDVRKNAMSMKYGFSKGTLQKACENAEIQYIHTPELGIVSDKRRNLASPSDYEALFREYKQSTLLEVEQEQETLAQLIVKSERAVLLCFERDARFCHRSHLADSLSRYFPSPFPISHFDG